MKIKILKMSISILFGMSMTCVVSANCDQKIIEQIQGGNHGYEVISSNPLNIRRIAPDNTFGDYANGTTVSNVSEEIENWKGVISSCPEPCIGYNEKRRNFIKWLQCVAGNKNKSNESDQMATTIQSCPPTLPASCVSWSLYDRQLNLWNVNNFCEKDAKVAYRGDSGTHEETQVFGPGEKTRVTWRGSRMPAYIVWDAQAAIKFYREKAPGAALQCRKNMPF